jgi:hypothetical protein
MNRLLALISFLFVVLFGASALAWDGPDMWYMPAAGSPISNPKGPGGGGILGTGGARDYGITCANCHTQGKSPYGLISAKIDFNPMLVASMYKPGQSYAITVTLIGEHLGLSGCGQYTPDNNNHVGLTIEDGSGNMAGSLRADMGSSTTCPADVPFDPNTFKGTFMYGDCKGVLSHGAGMTSWTFNWTAPPKGSGDATLYYGVVDGNCMMDSLDDDVKVGVMKMGEATAMREDPPKNANTALASVGAFPALMFLLRMLRRRRAR